MRELWNNRITRYGSILALLVIANIVSYIWRNWGLITVNVDDAPLSKVVRSIEWQGWVNIYTNLPLDQKVTMHVDHVPLAEAMATLAANVNGPANGDPPPDDRANRPDRGNRGDRPGAGGSPPMADNSAPPQQGLPGLPAASTPAPTGLPGLPAASVPQPPDGNTAGAPGGGRGGFPRGGGGFDGGGATWNLAFFVGPTKADVKEEIRAFEDGTARTNDKLKVYSFPTPLQFLGGSDQPSEADPRRQAWTGYKEPPAPPPPAPADDGQPAAPTTPTAPTVHTYLQAFAENADIWIMAPSDWDNNVATPPPADSSIIAAVKNFVSGSRGYVTQAIVLRMGTGGPRGVRPRGGDVFASMDAMTERMRNAINGLPSDERADATEQLTQEVAFFQSVRTAPPEQRMQLFQQHMAERMADNPNGNARRSPERRAQRFARLVQNRQAAIGPSGSHGATASGGGHR